jgi:hypothetical protein
MPAAPGVTVIRHNLFAKSANSSRNELARPNLLLGHFPPHGPGSDDVYEVTGNLFFCNPTEALAQFEGNVTARGNVLINPAGDGMHIQPHHDVPKNIDVTQNFFATAGRTIGLVKPSPAHRQAIRDNTLIAPAQQVAGEQAAQPALPPFAAALAHWLEAHEPARFAPLLAVADRMCSRAADTPPSRSVWRQHELRDHPVCTLMRLMRAPRTAARDAALLREIETASRKACSTP